MVKSKTKSSRARRQSMQLEPPPIARMAEVSYQDYRSFAAEHPSVEIENTDVPLSGPYTIKATGPSRSYQPEATSVWSFPDRGDWATHSGNYRGNWSPYIPRNLINRFTSPDELVLDSMVGSGTTLVECRLLGRRGTGIDVNPAAVMVTRDRLNFALGKLDADHIEPVIRTFVGDARALDAVADESVDLYVSHPPYASIVSYSNERVDGDLSRYRRIDEFMAQILQVAREAYRVVKPGRHCAILMGDTRRHRHFIPISTRTMMAFLEAGFTLREDVTKLQWKMKSTRENWAGSKYDFLLLAHEHLFIFRKLGPEESPTELKESRKWWTAWPTRDG